MPWVEWVPGEPHLGNSESPVVFNISLQKHFIQANIEPLPPFCALKEIPRYRLRGACMDTGLDTYFIFRSENNVLKRELVGFTHTRIQLSGSSNLTWEIVDTKEDTVLASTVLEDKEQKLLPTGKRKWTFHQANCSSNPSVPWREMNLHLSVNQPGHFCCGDGTCISSELRCDNNHDCVDASDEEDCQMLQPLSNVYNPDLPPQVMVARRYQRTFPKTVVNASLDIWVLLDITESTSEMSVIFALTLSWRDPHLRYNFLIFLFSDFLTPI